MKTNQRCGGMLLVITLVATGGGRVRTVGAQQVPRSFPSDSAVLALMKQYVAKKRFEGVIVGLVTPNGERHVLAYGNPGPGKLPLDGNTVIDIASITKSFTGTLLASAVLDGSVGLDDPVQTLLPPSVKVPVHNGREITVRHLSTHTSALVRDPPPNPVGSQGPTLGPDFTIEKLYNFLSGLTLPRDPGVKWQYSNVGESLLGNALARQRGVSYEQLVTERILTPLAMTHTAVTMTPWMDEHLALGYGPAGERLPWISIPAYDPAGGLKSTTNDLLAYVAANIDAHLGTRTDNLGRAMALAHRVHYQQARANESPILMGLNWFLNAGEADTLIWHGGGSGSGYATMIGFIPSRRMGVVVLTNSAREDAYELGFHLLDPSRRPPISTPQRRLWKQPAFIVTLAGVAMAVALVAWRWRR